jgi:hypothetical protein
MIVESEYPRKIQLAAKNGFERLKIYRRARAMFIRKFVGQYYSSTRGLTGNEPINLLFHTIRTMVPNLIMKNPVSHVTTEIVPYEEYGWLLGLALDNIHEKTNFKDILRAGIVSALIAFAIFKTGIADSGQIITYGDINIDPGQVYTDLVDLDDLTIDPSCKALDKAAFIGDRNRVPRQILLDDDSCDHDLVMKLPKSIHPDANNKIEKLTQSNLSQMEIFELQDYVDVVELFVPGADALLLIPDPDVIIFDDYIKGESYYGPKEGPYTFLSFTPPVPNNPQPISPASIWYDLDVMANRMMVKMMEQADRQKDIVVADPSGADEAEDMRTSKDGDVILGDPQSATVMSFGGQNVKNEAMLGQLHIWYNYIAGNPDQRAGLRSDAETATQASILETNANIIIEDERELIYECGAKISGKEAWYLHTDPLINLPLSKRLPGGKRVQLFLTPEQRCGDFLDFVFKFKPRSMSKLNPALKEKRMLDFAVNLIPGLMSSAQTAIQMGVQFNVQKAITDIAEQWDISDEVQDWFVDPDFEQRIQLMMMMGPQNAGKAGPLSIAGVNQNGGYPGARPIPGPETQFKQNAQQGANQAQSNIQGAY